MATGNKKNSRKSRGSSSASNSFQSDIILLIVLAATVLLFVSAYGMGGIVGNTISTFLFGAMGILAYFFPFVLFIGSAFLLSNKRNVLAYKKVIAGIVFFIVLCGLLQLLTEGYVRSTTLEEYYALCSDYRTGGGVVGGLICISTVSAFGLVGAYIIIIMVLLICLIVITQKSFFGFIYKIGDAFSGLAQGGRERYREGQPERELKKELRNQEKQRMREEKRAKRIRVLEEAISQEEKQKETRPSVTEKRPFMEGSKLLPDKPADPIPKKEMPDPPVMMPELSLPEVPAKEEQMQFEIHSEDMAHEEIDDFSEDVEEIYDEMEGIHPIERTSGPSEEPDIRKPARKTKATQQEVQDGIQNIAHEIQADEEKPKKKYVFPPLNLLNKSNGKKKGDSNEYIRQTAQKLQDTLCSFGVNATVTNVSCGPSVTRYELKPEMGVTVSKITRLSDDIKLNLAAEDIRIEAPIPGKTAVGIEVPNKEKSVVLLRDLLQSEEFQNAKSCISFAVGKDIEGKPVIADIAKMPHLLIAGATGSGKSVCINTLIISILYKAKPEDVKLIMIDPKVVELSVYNGIPHLLIPVVTDPKKAAGALNWAVSEMTARYNTFAEYGVRNLSEYTRKIEKMTVPADEQPPEKMPQIVVIVDELADLMMVASGEVEDAIVRLSQLARAAGIHLIIATQRPSVNVITGLIKANMPSRIAFSVSSGVDSRTILDTNGAEKLLGKGDMLFYPQGYPKAARVQGALVSDEEVSAIVGFLANKNPAAEYDAQIEQQVNTGSVSSGGSFAKDERDHYFMEAGKLIIEKDKASIGMLQRIFKIGFNRAARIMDQLNEAGVVGPEEGTKPRKVLMTMEQFEEYLASE